MILPDRVLDLTTLGRSAVLPRVVRLAWERRERDYRLRPGEWSWEQATIQVTVAGCGAVWMHGAGAAAPIPPGRALVYHNRSQRELVYGLPEAGCAWEFIYINLMGTAATAMIAELAERGGGVVAVDPQAQPWRGIREFLPQPGRPVHRAWSLAASTDLAQRALLAASGGAGAAEAPDIASDHVVAHAMAWVEPRLHERWTVARLARDLGVSREHLSRVFVADAGMPPAAWLRRARILAATRRLRGGEPVAAVARACGFADPAHFTAVFRAHHGMTPRDFRRSGGGGVG